MYLLTVLTIIILNKENTNYYCL